MVLVDPDNLSDPIASSEDNEAQTNRRDSYIEWTAPEAKQYYVVVYGVEQSTGRFSVSVEETSDELGGGDPCVAPGSTMTEPAAVISFQPDSPGGGSAYENDASCSWQIECSDGEAVSVVFSDFDTETGYDYLTLYDGSDKYNSPTTGQYHDP